MKKIIIILGILILSGNCLFAEDTLYEQGIALYNCNKIDQALETFLKIPQKERTADVWLLIGNILEDKNNRADAAFMYQHAMLITPNYYKPYYNLGLLYLEDERFHMAIDNFKKAAMYNPDFAYAHYNLGCTYLKLGELKKAKNEFNKAIALKNNEPDFHYNLAYVYKKLNKPKMAETYLKNYNDLIQNNVDKQ